MPGSEAHESWLPDGFQPPGVVAAEAENGADPYEREAWIPDLTRPRSRPAPTAPAPVVVPAEARTRPKPVARDDRLELNEITFDGLRTLGLSITQSKRLIAQRDQRGGFRSLEELDTAFGFPRDLIAELKRRCRV